MQALPAAPAPAPRNQLTVAATLAAAAVLMLFGGMLAVWAVLLAWSPKGITARLHFARVGGKNISFINEQVPKKLWRYVIDVPNTRTLQFNQPAIESIMRSKWSPAKPSAAAMKRPKLSWRQSVAMWLRSP